MIWYNDLYISDNLPQNSKKVIRIVERRIHVKPLFLVTLSEIEDGQLEIISLTSLRLPFFRQEHVKVVGVAKGYYHARSLVESIIAEVYEHTGGCDCKSYLDAGFGKGDK